MRRQFTIVELLIVVVVLGILMTITVPNIANTTLNASEVAIDTEVDLVENAVDSFYQRKGFYPTEDQNNEITPAEGEVGELIDIDLIVPYILHQRPEGEFYLRKDGSVAMKGFESRAGEIQDNPERDTPEADVPQEAVSDIYQLKYLSNSQGWEISGIVSDAYLKQGSPKELVLPNQYLGRPILSIGRDVFKNKGLTAVSLPRSLEEIGYGSFEGNSISTIELPKTLRRVGNQAFYKNQLAEIKIPYGVLSIGSSSFRENKIQNVVIPDSVKEIGGSSFYNNQLETLVLPHSIENVGNSSFQMNRIKTVTIPNSVKIIGKWAFRSNQLETVLIPENVEVIGDFAFANNRLNNVRIPASTHTIGKEAFHYNPTLKRMTGPEKFKSTLSTFVNSSPTYN